MTMNKNRIRLTESQLQRVIKESVKRILRESQIDEMYDIDDDGFIDYDEYGRAKNRSYTDKYKVSKNPSDVYQSLSQTPYRDPRAETNYGYREYERNPFSDDTGKYMRPSDYFVRGWDGDEKWGEDLEKMSKKHQNGNFDSADKRPLHRRGSLNREL